jgi:rare lipoprotein A
MTGVSSFYAEAFHGKLTANGEVYDMYGVTAAHKTLPLNTVARVTNLENNKSLILRINDRGPYVKGRILDCSYGAAKKLDFINNGTAKVKIEVIDWGDNKYMKHRN